MSEEKTYRDYLNKTFLEELNYKIWVTKGSRFNANKRLLIIAKWSNLCQSFLSVYLIAVGLMSVYNIYSGGINENLIAYTMTILSILLLVFGQIENAKDFKTKAKEFHNCGLELSELYNKLRIFKTLDDKTSEKEKRKFADKISEKYERILKRHENHNKLDYEVLLANNYKYHELKERYSYWIYFKHYCHTRLLYHILIFLPPIIICYIMLKVT
jgi:hypothetical protein